MRHLMAASTPRAQLMVVQALLESSWVTRAQVCVLIRVLVCIRVCVLVCSYICPYMCPHMCPHMSSWLARAQVEAAREADDKNCGEEGEEDFRHEGEENTRHAILMGRCLCRSARELNPGWSRPIC
jgi:hypothetical protein